MLAQTERDPAKMAVWILENARSMNESMFFDDDYRLHRLDPVHFLALRACAPSGVFTQKAKQGFLNQVTPNRELTELADAIFKDDYGFLNSLSEAYRDLKPQLRVLMQLAYEKGVRTPDRRVRAR